MRVIQFKIQDQTLDDFINIKKLVQISKIRPSIPYFLSYVPEQRQISKLNYEKIMKRKAEDEKQRAEDEEIINSVQDYAFMGGYDDKDFYPVDFNPRKCLFKVKGICFGRPFYAKGIGFYEKAQNLTKKGR